MKAEIHITIEVDTKDIRKLRGESLAIEHAIADWGQMLDCDINDVLVFVREIPRNWGTIVTKVRTEDIPPSRG